jgi:hypothetical protein
MSNTQKFDVSVILPIKSSKANGFADYFNKAITSIKDQQTQINELVIVHTDETSLVEYLNSYDFGELNVTKEVWTKEANFSAQVNHGVRVAKSNWVSIFEFDDEYSKIWFKMVSEYVNHYEDVQAFLPIVVDTDEKAQFAGFTNEATFALNITNDIGFLNNDILQNFQNFQIAGMVIKKQSYVDFGLLKPSFKLTFGYEFFLRMTHNSVKIMTIPRIGYKHTNLREGSIFWNYKNGEEKLNNQEVEFWINAAKKEYFFINDRAIKYEPTTN